MSKSHAHSLCFACGHRCSENSRITALIVGMMASSLLNWIHTASFGDSTIVGSHDSEKYGWNGSYFITTVDDLFVDEYDDEYMAHKF